jgi:hypothetical protein
MLPLYCKSKFFHTQSIFFCFKFNLKTVAVLVHFLTFQLQTEVVASRKHISPAIWYVHAT